MGDCAKQISHSALSLLTDCLVIVLPQVVEEVAGGSAAVAGVPVLEAVEVEALQAGAVARDEVAVATVAEAAARMVVAATEEVVDAASAGAVVLVGVVAVVAASEQAAAALAGVVSEGAGVVEVLRVEVGVVAADLRAEAADGVGAGAVDSVGVEAGVTVAAGVVVEGGVMVVEDGVVVEGVDVAGAETRHKPPFTHVDLDNHAHPGNTWRHSRCQLYLIRFEASKWRARKLIRQAARVETNLRTTVFHRSVYQLSLAVVRAQP